MGIRRLIRLAPGAEIAASAGIPEDDRCSGKGIGSSVGIDFERHRLVFPIEIVRISADALVGMFRAVMISPRGFGLAVFHSVIFLSIDTARR